MREALALAFLLNVLMAFVYIRVGRAVMERPVSQGAVLPRDSFAWWWYLLGTITIASAAGTALSAADLWTLDTFVVYTQVVIIVLMAALAALLYYFAYLLTGRHGAWRPIAVFYGLYTVAILYFIQAARPIALEDGRFGATIKYAHDLSGSAFALTIGLLLFVPILLGAGGYFLLFFRTQDRSQRFRIGTLALAFLFWFGISLVASYVFKVTDEEWWRVVSTLIALGASYIVYIGYRPPAWMARRFDLRGYALRPSEGRAAEAK